MIRIDTSRGTPLAGLLVFPIHPTVMGTQNLFLSSDVAGGIEQAFGQHTGAIGIFLNGAEGDVSPAGPRGDFRHVTRLGETIAQEAHRLWQSLKPSVPRQFQIRALNITLGQASLNIWPCLRLHWASGKGSLALTEWATSSTVTGLVIDGHAFVAVPGEPITKVGLSIKKAGEDLGFASTTILGLTNDYLGYILDREQYLKGGYEACVSFYGPLLGEGIVSSAARLLRDMTDR